MLDLMNIARTEAAGGDLLGTLGSLFEPADVRPEGYPDAVIWKGGNFTSNVNPVAHSLTDAYALLGTIAAIDILGLPYYAVPMWSQYRHDTKLASLSWFGSMPCTSIKWSTAGDAYVNDPSGERVVVMGKSGNAPLAHDGRRLLQCAPLRPDHRCSLHALPALLAGSGQVHGD